MVCRSSYTLLNVNGIYVQNYSQEDRNELILICHNGLHTQALPLETESVYTCTCIPGFEQSNFLYALYMLLKQ